MHYDLSVKAYVVVGGWPPSLSKSVIALLPGADSWSPLASLPGRAAQGAAAGIVAGRIQLTVASEVSYDDPDIKWLMFNQFSTETILLPDTFIH